MFFRPLLVSVVLVAAAGCGASVATDDAALACGWNEPELPAISVAQANPQQLARNTQKAAVRFEAAERVAEADGRFEVLAQALEEILLLAREVESMTDTERLSSDRWDFAKYAQAVARDQCEQLQAVIDRE